MKGTWIGFTSQSGVRIESSVGVRTRGPRVIYPMSVNQQQRPAASGDWRLATDEKEKSIHSSLVSNTSFSITN